MNILNIFTFKKDLKTNFSKEKITGLFEFVKAQILRFKELSHLSGAEKKMYVDKNVLMYIDTKLQSNNKIVKFAIEIIKAVVPVITQFVYDCLKSRIDGLTETGA